VRVDPLEGELPFPGVPALRDAREDPLDGVVGRSSPPPYSSVVHSSSSIRIRSGTRRLLSSTRAIGPSSAALVTAAVVVDDLAALDDLEPQEKFGGLGRHQPAEEPPHGAVDVAECIRVHLGQVLLAAERGLSRLDLGVAVEELVPEDLRDEAQFTQGAQVGDVGFGTDGEVFCCHGRALVSRATPGLTPAACRAIVRHPAKPLIYLKSG
jgi:hypothetical protein